MPWGGYILGYHGCDARLVQDLARGKKSLRSSQNDYDWLGRGIYFWEDSPERAMLWAKEAAKRKDSLVTNPAVVGAIIQPGNCLNLVQVEFLRMVRKAHARLMDVFRQAGTPPPRNTGQGDGARKLDCAVFEALHRTRKDEGREAFDTVRAFFVEGKPLYPTSGIRTLDHIQICVRDPKRIIGYFLPR